ncbi:hypothetical protein [Anaerotignum sp.]|uniref:hypothetical protein n=1 Tax=Anaerotignum sp. TaxID=2039241 RepID=UPI0033341102
MSKIRKHTGRSLYNQDRLKIIFGTNPVWETSQIPDGEYLTVQKTRSSIENEGKKWVWLSLEVL